MRTGDHRGLAAAAWIMAAACVQGPAFARSGLLAAINAARSATCGGQAHAAPLRAAKELDTVADGLSRGEGLRDALAKVGYRAMHSASLHLSRAGDDAAVARVVARQSCGDSRGETIREIGVARRGDGLWIVLAAPFAAPDLEDVGAVTRRVIELANEARSRPRRCGRQEFAAAPPLSRVAALGDAALAHSRDMARHGYLAHSGTDGTTPSDRIGHEGYRWRIVGENVASGPTSAAEVMAGWLASPGHCENLMDPRFTDTGVAFTVEAKSAAGVYWTQVFATPALHPRPPQGRP
jgi:uncharacterized protein YkwD